MITSSRVAFSPVLNRSGLIILSKRRPSAYRHFVDSARHGAESFKTCHSCHSLKPDARARPRVHVSLVSLNAIEHLAMDGCRVLAFMHLAAIGDLADIHAVLEHVRERTDGVALRGHVCPLAS